MRTRRTSMTVLGRARLVRAVLALMVGAVLVACDAPRTTTEPVKPHEPRSVYVAIGNGETAGNGSRDRIRDAWPQIVFREFLGRSAVFVNLGETNATVADALADQVPPALALRPTVVTVHLTDDRFRGTTLEDYEQQLTTMVRRLQRGGRTAVILGNVLPGDREPGVLACTPNPPPGSGECRIGPIADPTQGAARVAALNDVIARVGVAADAPVVDLHEAFMAERRQGREDRLWVGNDFSPNADGHRLIAAKFGAAVRDALKSRQ